MTGKFRPIKVVLAMDLRVVADGRDQPLDLTAKAAQA